MGPPAQPTKATGGPLEDGDQNGEKEKKKGKGVK